MIELSGVNVGSSVSEIVQGASEFVLALCAAIGGWFGWKKWSAEKALEKSSRLDALVEKFSNNELRKLICEIDSSGGASELVKSAMSGTSENDRLKVENALMFVALLCQLRTNNVVSDTEFLMFKDSVMKILDDDDIKAYISQSVFDSGLAPEDTHYTFLLRFAADNGISMDVDPHNGTRETEALRPETDNIQQISLSGPIHETEFDVPTAIIKINHKYREGMDDNEILDAVRGWWRLRMDIANKVEIVLAVANGYVKGVYRVEKWIKATLPETAGRIGFVGKPADEATCKKFKDRSTRDLFSKGAANPVRYFNVK